MEILRPSFADRLPGEQVAALAGENCGDRMAFCLGTERWVLSPGEATRVIFGTFPDEQAAPPAPSTPLGRALAAVFPLAAPWYGMNYV